VVVQIAEREGFKERGCRCGGKKEVRESSLQPPAISPQSPENSNRRFCDSIFKELWGLRCAPAAGPASNIIDE